MKLIYLHMHHAVPPTTHGCNSTHTRLVHILGDMHMNLSIDGLQHIKASCNRASKSSAV